jgi:hypothetical protein
MVSNHQYSRCATPNSAAIGVTRLVSIRVASPASALAYWPCLSDNYPCRMEGVPGCLHGHCRAPHAWARPVSSKQGNQAAKGGSGWPPPRYNATLFRTVTTSDPGSTSTMLELIAAGRLELRSRNHPQDIRTRDRKQPARVIQGKPRETIGLLCREGPEKTLARGNRGLLTRRISLTVLRRSTSHGASTCRATRNGTQLPLTTV